MRSEPGNDDRSADGPAMHPAVKACIKCGNTKPLTEYPPRAIAKDGRRGTCRECTNERMRRWEASPERVAVRRERHWADPEKRRKASRDRHRRLGIKKEYGISRAEKDAMNLRQDGCCLICGVRSSAALHVDHDHAKGIVRGLLCGKCNRGLGLFVEDLDRMEAAIRYLEGSRSR